MNIVRKTCGNFAKYLGLTLIALIMLFPILWMISSSLKTLIGISQYPPELIPADPQWNNYAEVF